MSVYQNNTEALSEYIQSMVRLEELQKMTEDLDKELEDSQRLMSEIKSIFNTVPNSQNMPQLNSDARREQLVQFLAADGPRMLLTDMVEAVDVNIETILSDLKNQAEDLKKNIGCPERRQESSGRPIENLDLEQYAANLDEFSKRLGNLKLNNSNGNNRNRVLEMKLAMLCQDVNNLTQAVQDKTKLAEKASENKSSNELDNATVLSYDILIDKLLHSINEASYLLKNIN